MKRVVTVLLLTLISTSIFAQGNNTLTTTGKIDSLADGWGKKTTYVGEIKNKTANGLGMAIYGNGNMRRYTGYFVNGKYEGRGILLYTGGGFLSGTWKNGQMEGMGAYCSPENIFYVGNFKETNQDGQGTSLYNNGNILSGSFKNGLLDGRVIFISNNSQITNDNIYVNGKKNGQGYQYDLANKKLFEGIWKDGEWEKATTGNYASYLKNSSFLGEKTSDHYIMGCTNEKAGLHLTAFYYDIAKKTGYYGTYNNSKLEDGAYVVENEKKFVGKYKEGVPNGYCYRLTNNKETKSENYQEGEFVNGKLIGVKSLGIALKLEWVYYGNFTDKGEYSGKAWMGNKYYLQSGDFDNTAMSGNGWQIDNNGYCIKGTWKNGEVAVAQSLTDNDGTPISLAPKTMAETLNILSQDFKKNTISSIASGRYESDVFNWVGDCYNGLLQIPGSENKSYSAEYLDGDEIYYTTIYKTSKNFAEANRKYIELCKQVQAAAVTNTKGRTPLKLMGNLIAAKEEDEVSMSSFSLPTTAKNPTQFHVTVVLMNDKKAGVYKTILLCGNKMDYDIWEYED